MTRWVIVVTALCLIGAVAAAQAAGGGARSKAIGGHVKLTITDVTKPENVGAEPEVDIKGRVVTSGKRAPRQCRRERSVTVKTGANGNLPGRVVGGEPATGGKGTFHDGHVSLEYGGIDPNDPDHGPYSGVIDFAGGDVSFSAVVKKTVAGIPGTFRTFKCKKLVSPTVTVTFPPYTF